MSTDAKIFLTDYASYNDGTQFEFGHWVDLSDYSDSEELSDYITEHFEECDKKSPLGFGAKREEIMITDYEGFPAEYYSESSMDFEKVFQYIEIIEQLDDDDDSWVQYNNQHSDNIGSDDHIYDFSEEELEQHFDGRMMDLARAVHFGDMNWSHSYFRYNGYANLETTDNPIDWIDKDEILNDMIEDPSNYSF